MKRKPTKAEKVDKISAIFEKELLRPLLKKWTWKINVHTQAGHLIGKFRPELAIPWVARFYAELLCISKFPDSEPELSKKFGDFPSDPKAVKWLTKNAPEFLVRTWDSYPKVLELILLEVIEIAPTLAALKVLYEAEDETGVVLSDSDELVKQMQQSLFTSVLPEKVFKNRRRPETFPTQAHFLNAYEEAIQNIDGGITQPKVVEKMKNICGEPQFGQRQFTREMSRFKLKWKRGVGIIETGQN